MNALITMSEASRGLLEEILSEDAGFLEFQKRTIAVVSNFILNIVKGSLVVG